MTGELAHILGEPIKWVTAEAVIESRLIPTTMGLVDETGDCLWRVDLPPMAEGYALVEKYAPIYGVVHRLYLDIPIPEDYEKPGHKKKAGVIAKEWGKDFAWILKKSPTPYGTDDYDDFFHRPEMIGAEPRSEAYLAYLDLCKFLFQLRKDEKAHIVNDYFNEWALWESVMTECVSFSRDEVKASKGECSKTAHRARIAAQYRALRDNKSDEDIENPYDPEKQPHHYYLIQNAIMVKQNGSTVQTNKIRRAWKRLLQSYQDYIRVLRSSAVDEDGNFIQLKPILVSRDGENVQTHDRPLSKRKRVSKISSSHGRGKHDRNT